MTDEWFTTAEGIRIMRDPNLTGKRWHCVGRQQYRVSPAIYEEAYKETEKVWTADQILRELSGT